MTTRAYVPYSGIAEDYGYGPAHQFFLWDTAAQAIEPASGDGIADAPGVKLRPDQIRTGIADERGGSPYGGSAMVEQSGRMNNPAQTERAIDVHRRGTADLTAGNIARALGMMASVPGALGPIKMGISLARNPDPFTGSVPATQWGRDMVRRGVPVRDVQKIERDTGGHGPGAGGRGHTGEGPAQGGAGGGPKGGQQMGGGKRAYRHGGIVGYEMGGGVHEPRLWQPPMRRPPPRRRGVGPTDGPIRPRPMPTRPLPTAPRPMPGAARPMPLYPDGGMRPGFADGGIVGAVRSSSPGRADKVEANAEEGSYIIPADVVSALGEGNTAAGVKWLDGAVERLMAGDTSAFGFKRGGRVPVRLSGGEYAVPPTAVAALGKGSYEAGARKVEALIAQIRKGSAQQMAQLPGPRR
jgi:hypothetical protein